MQLYRCSVKYAVVPEDMRIKRSVDSKSKQKLILSDVHKVMTFMLSKKNDNIVQAWFWNKEYTQK